MKKKITAALLAVMLACASSCGAAEKTTTAASAAPEKVTDEAPTPEEPAEPASAADITAAVLDEVPIASAFEKGIDDLPFYFDSLNTDGLDDFSYFMCASGAFPDEIAVFRFSSGQLAKDGLEAVKERMEQQRATYETYTPAEMYKFDDAVAEVSGNYVIYLITSDNAAAKKIVNGYIG